MRYPLFSKRGPFCYTIPMNTTPGLPDLLPVFHELDPKSQEALKSASFLRDAEKGTVVHRGSSDCIGLILIASGQMRAFSLSEEGREITLYRLLDGDACLFSASCMMRDIQFEIILETEKDTTFWVIPSETYEKVMQDSLPLATYTNQLMASRFSDVMWLLEQIMWKRFDQRLADFLLEESLLDETARLTITHEAIAKHLGTAREVVTRMLRYFQEEGLVELSRGVVQITDEAGLRALL